MNPLVGFLSIDIELCIHRAVNTSQHGERNENRNGWILSMTSFLWENEEIQYIFLFDSIWGKWWKTTFLWDVEKFSAQILLASKASLPKKRSSEIITKSDSRKIRRWCRSRKVLFSYETAICSHGDGMRHQSASTTSLWRFFLMLRSELPLLWCNLCRISLST